MFMNDLHGGLSTDLVETIVRELVGAPAPRAETTFGNVLVTGAGGFIGSHVCSALQGAQRLVLLEQNEYALYKVHQQLPQALPVLGSYGDRGLVRDVLGTFGIDTVFHVGAYKHVPLVERNMLPALKNNVLDFAVLAEEVSREGGQRVQQLVVVSSDKAVCPTNIMGVSKKLVEGLALSSSVPHVKVVRFGNVLWSTGSVLPLFYDQLVSGRPVTLTDNAVDRYFMSAQQAADLVLQAALLPARGVYVYDMGPPIRIRDVVKVMAGALGVPYKIKVTGLRPGEKLHEELTLGEGLQETGVPRVLFAREPQATAKKVWELCNQLQDVLVHRDVGACRALLQAFIASYTPQCGIIDDIFLHKNVFGKEEVLDDCFQVPTNTP